MQHASERFTTESELRYYANEKDDMMKMIPLSD